MRDDPPPFEQIGRLVRETLHAALWLFMSAVALVASVALALSHSTAAP